MRRAAAASCAARPSLAAKMTKKQDPSGRQRGRAAIDADGPTFAECEGALAVLLVSYTVFRIAESYVWNLRLATCCTGWPGRRSQSSSCVIVDVHLPQRLFVHKHEQRLSSSDRCVRDCNATQQDVSRDIIEKTTE